RSTRPAGTWSAPCARPSRVQMSLAMPNCTLATGSSPPPCPIGSTAPEVRQGTSALQRPRQQAAHEEAAEQDIDQQRGYGGYQRHSHLHVSGQREGPGEVVDRDGDRPVLLAGEQAAEQEVVPR